MHLVAVGGSDAGISAALRARELDPHGRRHRRRRRRLPELLASAASPTTSPARSPTGATSPTAPPPTSRPPGCELRLDTRATRIDVADTGQAAPARARTRRPRRRRSPTTRSSSAPAPSPSARRSPASDRARPRRRRPPAALHGRHLRRRRAPSTARRRHPRSSSAPATSAWRWPRPSPPAACASPRSRPSPRCCRPSTPSSAPSSTPNSAARRRGPHRHRRHRRTPARPARPAGCASRAAPGRHRVTREADLVLVVVGVRPDTDLAAAAGARLGVKRRHRRRRPHAHRPARRLRRRRLRRHPPPAARQHLAAAGHDRAQAGPRRRRERRSAATVAFAGSLGTQVVKVFDLVAARTGLRDHEAVAAGQGWTPLTVGSPPDDHKAYYPGATPIAIRVTGDRSTGRLLGAQLVGRRGAEIAKRVDVYATALHHEHDRRRDRATSTSRTPRRSARPWDAVQAASQV